MHVRGGGLHVHGGGAEQGHVDVVQPVAATRVSCEGEGRLPCRGGVEQQRRGTLTLTLTLLQTETDIAVVGWPWLGDGWKWP